MKARIGVDVELGPVHTAALVLVVSQLLGVSGRSSLARAESLRDTGACA
ncbi:hypothetical protein [Rhodanobacter sp. B2A1Ga4]|nr:hypothetical protein [Rhodanobacter sp. B2A1Ga4]